MDHRVDQYYQWPVNNQSFWLERGVFSSMVIKGGDVLELACGDGFNANHFYSRKANSIVACDFDPDAIMIANKHNKACNINFELADIRTNMPKGKFDNIVWDAAIEHFTPKEITEIILNMKQRLKPNGIVSGYTIVERSDGKKSLEHHEYEFANKEDLFSFWSPHFENVWVFETVFEERHNLYFWASDGVLPFSEDSNADIAKA